MFWSSVSRANPFWDGRFSVVNSLSDGRIIWERGSKTASDVETIRAMNGALICVKSGRPANSSAVNTPGKCWLRELMGGGGWEGRLIGLADLQNLIKAKCCFHGRQDPNRRTDRENERRAHHIEKVK